MRFDKSNRPSNEKFLNRLRLYKFNFKGKNNSQIDKNQMSNNQLEIQCVFFLNETFIDDFDDKNYTDFDQQE